MLEFYSLIEESIHSKLKINLSFIGILTLIAAIALIFCGILNIVYFFTNRQPTVENKSNEYEQPRQVEMSNKL